MNLRRLANSVITIVVFGHLLVCFGGCAEDIYDTQNGGKGNMEMVFSVEASSEWEDVSHSTRSISDSIARPYLMTMKNSNGEEMPLRSSATRGIRVFEDKHHPITRGEPVTTVQNNTFGLSAYTIKRSENWSTATSKITYIQNIEVSKGTSETNFTIKSSGTTPKYYWPSSDYKVNLFAYAPYSVGDYLRMEDDANGIGQLYYSVPTTISSQHDVLVSSCEVDYSHFASPYPMEFNHALTAIQFAVGNLAPCEVAKIQISNVYGAGYYQFPKLSSTNADERNGGWQVTGSANATYSIEPEYATTGTSSSAALVITGTDQNSNSRRTNLTMLLIPQELPNTATLTVTLRFEDKYTHVKTDVPYTVNIGGSGKRWNSGQTVTYTISSTSLNDILIAEDPTAFEYNNTSSEYHTFYVESTTWAGSAVSTPVHWTAKFVNESGTEIAKPSWIASCETSYSGSNAYVYARVAANPHAVSTDPNHTSHTNYMKSSAQRGTNTNINTYWDLSTQDYSENNDVAVNNTKPRNTANCYIISHPGYYKFPIVYGNAIKNGATNANAYTSIHSGDYILTHFVRHDNNPITNPWIKNNGFTPTSAALLWQDQIGLIQNLAIEGDYVKFYVASNRICQGNALISVKDASGNNLWSWHIWFTDADMNSTVKIHNQTGFQYELMPNCLGWTSGISETSFYPSESAILRITNEHNKTVDIIIRQNSYFTSSNTDGGVLVYQWGRKDPFIAAANNKELSTTEKTVYNISNAVIASPVTKTAATGRIGDAVANPTTYYLGNDWLGDVTGEDEDKTKHFWNLWSANSNVTSANDNAVVKTVYDPCPAGFCLPPSNAFTGFTDDGFDHGKWNLFDDRTGQNGEPVTSDTRDMTHFNVDKSFGYNGGWYFYCGTPENGLWEKGEKMFIVTIGERGWSTGNLGAGDYGHYWTAVAGPVPEQWHDATGFHEAYGLTINNQPVTARTELMSKAYNARFLFFTPQYVDPIDMQRGTGRSHNKGYGWNVWPIKEKDNW